MVWLFISVVQVDTFHQGKVRGVVYRSESREELVSYLRAHSAKTERQRAVAVFERTPGASYVPFSPGDGWLNPRAVDNSSDATTRPILQVDTFGNLWAAVLDNTNRRIKLAYSLDDGETWNAFGTISIPDAHIWEFGFKIDQGTNLFHFGVVYWDWWATSYSPEFGPYYCSTEGQYYTVQVRWEASNDDQADVKAITLQVSYSNDTPQTGSILYDVPIEEDWWRRGTAWYEPDPWDTCWGWFYDTLWIAGDEEAEVAFERDFSQNYGYLGYVSEIWKITSRTRYYNGAMVSLNIDSSLDTALLAVSRSTDRGASWQGHTSTLRLLRAGGFLVNLRSAAGSASSPGVHFVVLDTSNRQAHYFGSTDRGSTWHSAQRSFGTPPEDDAVAQSYGSGDVVWLVSSGGSVQFNYSSDRGQSWTNFTRTSGVYGPVAVYPDGEEDPVASSSEFYAGIWRDGNILFVKAPVSQAGNPASWYTPGSLDSLAIEDTDPSYPADRSQISILSFVWNGEYVPGLAWTKSQDNFFTRPTKSLFAGSSERSAEPIRLTKTITDGTLLFSGPAAGKVLKVFDPAGRVVAELRLAGNAARLSLPKGVYFWSLGGEVGQFVVK